jgi:hypothetical protein
MLQIGFAGMSLHSLGAKDVSPISCGNSKIFAMVEITESVSFSEDPLGCLSRFWLECV